MYWASFGQTKEESNVSLIQVDDLGWADVGVFGEIFTERPISSIGRITDNQTINFQ